MSPGTFIITSAPKVSLINKAGVNIDDHRSALCIINAKSLIVLHVALGELKSAAGRNVSSAETTKVLICRPQKCASRVLFV